MKEPARPVVATRIDLRLIAVVILYFESKMEHAYDFMPDTVSEIVRYVFEERAKEMVREMPEILVKSYEDAIRVFRSRHFKVPERDASRRAIMKQLQREHLESDYQGIEVDLRRRTKKEVLRPDFMPPPLNEENDDKEDVEQGRSRAPQSIGADNEGEAEGALKSA